MEPIPTNGIPAYLPSTGQQQQEPNEKKRELHKRHPARGAAERRTDEGIESNETNSEQPGSGSDGILGTLIDVEG